MLPLLVIYLIGIAVFGACFMLAIWITGRPDNFVLIVFGTCILEWPLVVSISVLCCVLLLSFGGPLWVAERFGWVKQVSFITEATQ